MLLKQTRPPRHARCILSGPAPRLVTTSNVSSITGTGMRRPGAMAVVAALTRRAAARTRLGNEFPKPLPFFEYQKDGWVRAGVPPERSGRQTSREAKKHRASRSYPDLGRVFLSAAPFKSRLKQTRPPQRPRFIPSGTGPGPVTVSIHARPFRPSQLRCSGIRAAPSAAKIPGYRGTWSDCG